VVSNMHVGSEIGVVYSTCTCGADTQCLSQRLPRPLISTMRGALKPATFVENCFTFTACSVSAPLVIASWLTRARVASLALHLQA
jgi:hypothetical protein